MKTPVRYSAQSNTIIDIHGRVVADCNGMRIGDRDLFVEVINSRAELLEALKIALKLLDATLGTAQWAPGGREWADEKVRRIEAALRLCEGE